MLHSVGGGGEGATARHVMRLECLQLRRSRRWSRRWSSILTAQLLTDMVRVLGCSSGAQEVVLVTAGPNIRAEFNLLVRLDASQMRWGGTRICAQNKEIARAVTITATASIDDDETWKATADITWEE